MYNHPHPPHRLSELHSFIRGVSPLEDVLDGHVAAVGLELQEQGGAEGVAVRHEAQHGHGHLGQHRARDLRQDHLQVVEAQPHAVPGWGARGTAVG